MKVCLKELKETLYHLKNQNCFPMNQTFFKHFDKEPCNLMTNAPIKKPV
jgi:hypothetical protein